MGRDDDLQTVESLLDYFGDEAAAVVDNAKAREWIARAARETGVLSEAQKSPEDRL